MVEENKQLEKREQFSQIIDETELFGDLELIEFSSIDELTIGYGRNSETALCYTHKTIPDLYFYPPVVPRYTEFDNKENAEKYRAIKCAQDFVIDVAKGVFERPYYWDTNLKQWILKHT